MRHLVFLLQFHLTNFSEVQNNRSTRYFDETDDDASEAAAAGQIPVSKRQPTVIYVDPDEIKPNKQPPDPIPLSNGGSADKDYLGLFLPRRSETSLQTLIIYVFFVHRNAKI
jgi:hypothetical protein